MSYNPEKDASLSAMKPFLVIVGVILIGAGVALSLFYAHIIYQVFHAPEDVKIITYLKETVEQSSYGDDLLTGRIGDQPVQLEVSDSAVIMVTIMLALIGLSIFAMVARMLIEGGAAILKIYTLPESIRRKMKADSR